MAKLLICIAAVLTFAGLALASTLRDYTMAADLLKVLKPLGVNTVADLNQKSADGNISADRLFNLVNAISDASDGKFGNINSATAGHMLKLFDIHDDDENGDVPDLKPKELLHALNDNSKKDFNVDLSEAKLNIQKAIYFIEKDTNHDGKLTPKELGVEIANPQWKALQSDDDHSTINFEEFKGIPDSDNDGVFGQNDVTAFFNKK